MKKTYLYFFLMITIIVSGITCKQSRMERHSVVKKSESNQSEEIEPGLGKGQGGKGRGLGRLVKAGKGIEKSLELTPEETQAIDIEMKPARMKKIGSITMATGKVKANENKVAIVGPLFSGRIKDVFVNAGDWVKKGDKLVILESVDVATAKSAFYKDYASMELAKINYERQQRLFKENITSQKNLASSEADYKIATANLNASEKNLHTLGFTEEDVKKLATTHEINPTIYLSTPISGRVVKREAIIGAMVDQSNDLFTIMDLSTLWIDADIYEKDLSLIKVGEKVEVTVPAYSEKIFSGKVVFICDIFNKETRTVCVRTEVANKNSLLKVGMFANVEISTGRERNALVVPIDAVLDSGGEKLVLVKEGNSFYQKVVRVGTRFDNLIEILSGLKEGDEVVVKGNSQILSELSDKDISLGVIH